MKILQSKKSSTRDMTSGSISAQLILFALPLLLGNIFQLLYNTVDTWVLGNYVSTQALAAVGSTTMVVNIIVFFSMGLSLGATVIISHDFGAKDMKALHDDIETTMAMTFVSCILFTVLGILLVKPMLRMMSTPEDVIPEATIYLRIYFAGISGLLIYNMGSGILRAVGDTTRPLIFLIITSLLNIVLDLFFVLVIKDGIAGVAIATILSQFISAGLVMLLLSRTDDIYRLTWHDLRINPRILLHILGIGLPTAIQSTITSLSNVFVQGYINVFGSDAMAGWSCYNKIDQFVMLPMQSMAQSATTFVSQNIGAKNEKRADRGTVMSIVLTFIITAVLVTAIYLFAEPATRLFTKDSAVITLGVRFLRTNVLFLVTNVVNHVLAGALRGRGDSRGPMVIMLIGFVAVRQLYLFLVTHYFMNTEVVVALGYPVGWISCCLLELGYYLIRYKWLKKVPSFSK